MKAKKKLTKKIRKQAKAFATDPVQALKRTRYGWLAVVLPVLWENRETILDFVGEASGRIQQAADRVRETRARSASPAASHEKGIARRLREAS